MTITELENELIAAGYKPEAPNNQAAVIDAQVCREGTCKACGQQRLLYHPFFRNGPRSYRPFSECPNCAKVVEF